MCKYKRKASGLCYPNKMNHLLHEENFRRVLINGGRIQSWLENRAAYLSESLQGVPDPDVSIIIRTRNDAIHIRRLFEDIEAQDYSGDVEIIVVDTESRDNTLRYAKAQGVKIVSITQKEFNYPKALNLGFMAARHPWVVTLVGHSSLSSRYFLKSLTYWSHQETNLAGIFALPIANWDASVFERLENLIAPEVWREPKTIDELVIGIMSANSSIVKREVWETLGGYDERYAGGGEDRALAQSMLDHKMLIIREPLCSVFHSHGLSLRNSVRQWMHWGEVAKKPVPFKTDEVHGRRPDLR